MSSLAPSIKGPERKGESLAERFLSVRRTTTWLALSLSPEDQMVQSMPDASPTKWHLAHTTWFFETFVLAKTVSGYSSFHPDFTYLFNSYYKGLGGHPLRSRRGTLSRPRCSDITAYREHVDEAIVRAIESGVAPEVLSLIELGMQHEQQHQELIVTDIKHAFWTNPLHPAYRSHTGMEKAGEIPNLTWLEFDGGLHEIGHAERGFAFDNECPRHSVFLNAFRIASRLVTNREYLEFMSDGGYKRSDLWLSDGWDRVCTEGWDSPLYWIFADGGWRVFTSSGVSDVVEDEPVIHVSQYEADAYARWAGARLATEAEWEIASAQPGCSGTFLESERMHPARAAGKGLCQMLGDAWEWTNSAYLPYPGFRPAEGVLGEYNGKFMSNQIVLRGGSCVTPQSHIRRTYRNFFPPQARWQFAGIRLANECS